MDKLELLALLRDPQTIGAAIEVGRDMQSLGVLSLATEGMSKEQRASTLLQVGAAMVKVAARQLDVLPSTGLATWLLNSREA